MTAPRYTERGEPQIEPEACLAEAEAAFRLSDLDGTCAWLQEASNGLARLTRVDGGQAGPYAESAGRRRLQHLRTSIHGLLNEIQTQAEETRRELELLRTRRPNAEDTSARWFESRA